MENVSIPKVIERLQTLPADKLNAVYDFVSFLAERQVDLRQVLERSESYQTMLASEQILRRDWDLAEEVEAWKDL